jgi:asparagine N-glycosylation enzyme membrane subunit Stt3
MWWIFGLINMVIVIGFAWFYLKNIKENNSWFRNDKIALGTLLVLSFLSGFLGTLFFGGLLVYLIIDFIRFVRK